MRTRDIIIDTDPGIDDATAITLAIRNEHLNVKLISTVAANVEVEKTTKNALKLVEFLDVDVPVAKGCERPLLHELETCSDVMGESGMDGYDFPPVTRKPLKEHSVEAMRRVIMENEEKITLVTIGALTNIAILFRMYPEVKENIEEIVMMGGSIFSGNTNSVAEFNIYNDPHAAAIVLESGVKINMLILDTTERALLYRENLLKVKNSGEVGNMLYSLFENYRSGDMDTGLMIHDASTIAFLLRPDLFKTEEKYIEVVTEGIAAGALVTDTWIDRHADKTPNVNVCVDVDAEKFEEWFVGEFYS